MSESIYEPVQKGRLRASFEAASARINRLIAAHFGNRIPLYCVAEFPRSGGTWLSGMMADYLRCAKPGASVFPVGFRSVLHSHWSYHEKLARTVYLIRDGRDVMISLYFYTLSAFRKSVTGSTGNLRVRNRLQHAHGNTLDGNDSDEKLKRFLIKEFENPSAIRSMNWAQHIHNWYRPEDRRGILYLKYEDLLAHPVDSLRKAVEHVSPIDADRRLLERSVNHYSMESITGRRPGDTDHDAFVRKGIVGDWQNHFNKEVAEIFDHYAGQELIRLGYEENRGWIEKCPVK